MSLLGRLNDFIWEMKQSWTFDESAHRCIVELLERVEKLEKEVEELKATRTTGGFMRGKPWS